MVVNVEVYLFRGESTEKLIKRFFKKCKKSDILKEYTDRITFYRKPSEKRKSKWLKNKWFKNKKNFDKKC
jgi:ribosomal protein S21